MKVFESHSEAETIELACDFAKNLVPGSIVALTGDLGAGKTAFVKGIARQFNSCEDVSSPTFTIVNQYDGDITIFHFDAYRLENADADSLDWLDDYLFSDGICVIEWAKNIQMVLPRGYISVTIEKDTKIGEDFRRIVIE